MIPYYESSPGSIHQGNASQLEKTRETRENARSTKKQSEVKELKNARRVNFPLKAYVTPSCVVPPSGQTDKLLPAEALTDYTV